MARSFKKTPIFSSTCAETEKQEKRKANRALRRKVNVELDKVKDVETAEEIILPEMREVSDTWTFAKDGKRYWEPSLSSPDYDYDNEVQTGLLRK